MKKVFLLIVIGLAGAATAQAAELPCRDEYQKLGEATALMTSPDLDQTKIQKAQSLLDEWQPKYQSCMDAYGKANGANAQAELEAKLTAGS